jgi:ribonuclease D
MLAARLLGITQFSLSNLVQQMLEVNLEKGPQKANWAVRPLTARMEAYARNDTRHLKPLADKLTEELKAKGRLEWHSESCRRLIEDCSIEAASDPDDVWRLKGSRRLSRPSLAVLRELWHWREAEATRANKPPYFILSHETMVRLAEDAAESRPINGLLPKTMSDRRRAALLKAIEKGVSVPPDHQPRIPRTITRKPIEAERQRYTRLQRIRDAHATALGIDPALIANKTMLSELAHNWEKFAPTLMNWQRALLEKAV